MLAASQDSSAPQNMMQANGTVSLDDLTQMLHVTKTDLAAVLGLSRDAVSKSARVTAGPTQRRLRDLVEILTRTAPWAGSVPQAFAWFCAQPLPSFGDQTAADLVREGRADAVKVYISRIAVGGYA